MLAMADTFLICWLVGEDKNSVFPVKISASELVGTLREVIKDKRQLLRETDAALLRLWQVSSTITCTRFPSREHLRPLEDFHTLRR